MYSKAPGFVNWKPLTALAYAMEQSTVASPWLLLLCLAAAATAGAHLARAQPDINGFISIDCGLPENAAGYVDNTTKLRLTGDAGFIDAGTNHNISAEYITPRLARGWHTVRSFPVGERNCYTLRPLVLPGPKYLVRAMFKYGNYDGLDMLPIFDLHLGVNYWKTVNISDASSPVMEEVIAVVPGGSVQVCLVNTGSGTPFISSLSLRPLTKALYPQANATQGLRNIYSNSI
ncbi:probable LRR receptor-like serine/threonine-protein kinase At4g29180 [Triticum aestivum]|uniref:probable LRR receptor-like serine/threonine-protein kinase At4g29180 n=1 Tax=Triticum aestivum TaxID=4565 RepID=UPI001D023CC2|nr:probable LRR receptor-like serine/threonine-protein kinase At4g29180 [Triticum aestivum]